MIAPDPIKEPSDPRPWIRAVVGTGFLSGNVVVGIYLWLFHDLEVLFSNPGAIIGGFLGLGLLGMAAGTITGLFSKLVLDQVTDSPKTWWIALAISFLFSSAIALLVVNFLSGIILGPWW